MLFPEGLAKPPGAMPFAAPPPQCCGARCAQWAREKCCSFFLFWRRSSNLFRRRSSGVPEATGTALERRRNKNFRTSRHHPPSSVHRRGCRRGMHCGKLWPHHPWTLPPHPRPDGHPRALCRLRRPYLHPQFNPPINLLGPLGPLRLNGHQWPPQHRPSPSTPTPTTRTTRTRANRWGIAPRCPCPRMGQQGVQG